MSNSRCPSVRQSFCGYAEAIEIRAWNCFLAFGICKYIVSPYLHNYVEKSTSLLLNMAHVLHYSNTLRMERVLSTCARHVITRKYPLRGYLLSSYLRVSYTTALMWVKECVFKIYNTYVCSLALLRA